MLVVGHWQKFGPKSSMQFIKCVVGVKSDWSISIILTSRLWCDFFCHISNNSETEKIVPPGLRSSLLFFPLTQSQLRSSVYLHTNMAASVTSYLTHDTHHLHAKCFFFFFLCFFRTNNQLVAFLSKYRDMNFIKSHGRDNARWEFSEVASVSFSLFPLCLSISLSLSLCL